MFVITYRKIFFIFSSITIALSVIFVLVWGLVFGIDFTGGTLIEVSYGGTATSQPAATSTAQAGTTISAGTTTASATSVVPDKGAVEARLDTLAIGAYSLRPSEGNGYILRTHDLNQEEENAVENALSLGGTAPMNVDRVNTVGPVLGEELRGKAFFAITVVVLLIIFFIAFAFRHVSKPVSSWKYGTIAIVVLVHDILLPVGLFAVLGKFFGAEVDGLFVMALLAILGYSVNDTIVVFDRIRENLRHNVETNTREEFDITVGKSLSQTFVRSFNTSLTTGLTLLALFLFGSSSTHYFSLTLLAGVIAGTYSSIFLAAPLLVWVNNLAPAAQTASGKNKKKKKR